MLPENDRVLMVMIYVQGMALKEIAKLLQDAESWGSLLHSRVTSGKSRSQRCSWDDHLRAVGGALKALGTASISAPNVGCGSDPSTAAVMDTFDASVTSIGSPGRCSGARSRMG